MRLALLTLLLAACGGVQSGQPLQSKSDVDRDEVPDVIDKCPYNPGPDANSGCPMQSKPGPSASPDGDNDGIADRGDQCPVEPEDRDGFEDEDGCPEVDNDKDGVADVVDKCPSVTAKTPDGCPPPAALAGSNAPADPPPPKPTKTATAKPNDRDGDGILDENDRCPDQPEDVDSVDDTDGCPEPDNDSDGIPDVADKCPNLPESKNGKADADGCPD
ncbi:MAG: thrombospondin type 3 repeat-containing protein [Kofleriaceae bacterium]